MKEFNTFLANFYFSQPESPLQATGRENDGSIEPSAKHLEDISMLEMEGLKAVVSTIISNYQQVEPDSFISNCETTLNHGKLNLLEGFPFGEHHRFALEYAYIGFFGEPIFAFFDREKDAFLYAFI